MTSRRTIALRRPAISLERLGFFRFGIVDGAVILTNDAGDWCFLDQPTFLGFLAGRLEASDPRMALLRQKRMLREESLADDLAAEVARRKRFLGRPPERHVVAVTRRTCREQPSAGADMSAETAKKVVDFAMKQTPGPMVFELVGGEPSLNLPTVRFLVEYVLEKNRYEARPVGFELRTEFDGMTDGDARWLAATQVLVRTRLDGPRDLHDAHASRMGRTTFDRIARWARTLEREYASAGLDRDRWHVRAEPVITRLSFGRFPDIANTYLSLGIRSMRLDALRPWNVPAESWTDLGYEVEDYLPFYETALEHLFALAAGGQELAEETAAGCAAKILGGVHATWSPIRSPAGAGISELAYDVDGSIHPDAESRRLAAEGDDLLALGSVDAATPDDVRRSPAVRTLMLASLQDAIPGCQTCWNNAFCGVSPVYNYRRFGDFFGQRPRSAECAEHMRLSELLLGYIRADERGAIESVLRRWIDLAIRGRETARGVTRGNQQPESQTPQDRPQAESVPPAG